MLDVDGTNIPDDEVTKFIEQVHHYQREIQKITGVEDKLYHPQAIREFLHGYYRMFPTHEHWMATTGWHHRMGYSTVMDMCASHYAGRGNFSQYPYYNVFGEVNSKALHFATADSHKRSYMIHSVEHANGRS